MTISPAQVKAARQLLGWSQDVLGGKAGLSKTSIALFETGGRRPTTLNVTVQPASNSPRMRSACERRTSVEQHVRPPMDFWNSGPHRCFRGARGADVDALATAVTMPEIAAMLRPHRLDDGSSWRPEAIRRLIEKALK
jgi:DNA-binding XRE family transcriptional regulator